MKTLSTLRSAANRQIFSSMVALVSFFPAVYPEMVKAAVQTQEENQSIIFEINNPESPAVKNDLTAQNTLSIEQLQNSDPLCVKLKDYLLAHNSPLAEYACDIILQPQWQRALAISWVESNFCLHHVDYNCSGIGVAPGHPSWRKYENHLEWFKDMTQLMERDIYKNKYTTFEKMKGVYVQPGSRSWVYGAKTKYAELMALTAEAEEQRIALAQVQGQKESLHTFPELALLTK